MTYRPFITRAQARRRRRLLALLVAAGVLLAGSWAIDARWTQSDRLQGQYEAGE